MKAIDHNLRHPAKYMTKQWTVISSVKKKKIQSTPYHATQDIKKKQNMETMEPNGVEDSIDS